MRLNTFIPSWNKAQFVDMLSSKYNVSKSKFNKMKKKQLIAIYCNCNKSIIRDSCPYS